ncbi:hypothetical protein [Sphingomonas endolithica]|uniref:hypothetical protein n=1 Tax=Sphingomonas endolithica TaxID=2972485 RepID=UPI0021B018A8|nr:hypothetical protein [Sphingomonas sp. ZFBP2030]
MVTGYKLWIPLVAIAVAACSAASGGPGNEADASPTTTADSPSPAGRTAASPAKWAAGEPPLKLAAPADPAAIAAVRRAADRLTDITITAAQSFKIMQGGQQVATFVAGEGKAPDATNAGCFAALVRDGRATVLPTIGSGAWEAETCLATSAVGILDAGNSVRIGVIYQAASPNAEPLEPVILRWDRGAGSFAIDEAASTRASIAGATSVAALRRLPD